MVSSMDQLLILPSLPTLVGFRNDAGPGIRHVAESDSWYQQRQHRDRAVGFHAVSCTVTAEDVYVPANLAVIPLPHRPQLRAIGCYCVSR